MRHELWSAILATRGDLEKLVAAAVGDYPGNGPPRAVQPAAPVRRASSTPSAPTMRLVMPSAARGTVAATAAGTAVATPAVAVGVGEHATLDRLHQDCHARIESLRTLMAPEPGGEQAMIALVLYFDERIMDLLPDYLATSWPLLQTRLTGRKTGGSDFFRLADRLLETGSQPTLVFEVYYWCLASGFQGEYADDLATLTGYQGRLRGHLGATEPEETVARPAASPSPSPIKTAIWYYVAAAAAVVLVMVLLTVGSNR